MRRCKLLFVCGFLASAVSAHAGLITSPALSNYVSCSKTFRGEGGPFQPARMSKGPDRLYESTSVARWELDDYGPIYRHSTLNMSVSEKMVIEEYSPALDMGPSRPWIQTLQNLGQLPRDLNVLATDPRGVRWSDIDGFMRQMGLLEYAHPARHAHLEANRLQYARALWPGFQFAMSQYPRRAWFTPDFLKGAVDTFNKTLRTATYIIMRNRETGKPVASIRLIRVHDGILRLRHLKTGRVLEVMGNAEYTWGADGRFRLSKRMLTEVHQLDRFVPEFLRSSEPVVKKMSEFEPLEMIRLPMEESLGIELPRNYEMMDLRQQEDFRQDATLTVQGETFEVSYGHAVLVEPGLFAIEKSGDRGSVFVELSIWMGKYLSIPRLPDWVKSPSVAYWTYNDLPLYVMFGFDKDPSFAPVHKYQVHWNVYSAGVSDIQQALRRLAAGRSDDTERARLLNHFLHELEARGF